MRTDIQLYNQALDYAKYGNWQLASSLLFKAIDLNDREAEYYSLLGVCHLGLGSPFDAIDQFRIAYNLNPKDSLLQPYILLLILGVRTLLRDKDLPPSSGPCVPREPHPLLPTSGAEAVPDDGISTIP